MKIQSKTVLTKEKMLHVLNLLTIKSYIIYIAFGVIDLISSIAMTIVGEGYFKLIGMILILLGLLLIALPFLNVFIVKNALKKDPNFKEDTTYKYEFMDEQVKITIDDVSIAKTYNSFIKIRNLKKYLVIYQNHEIAYIVSKESFSEDDFKAIMNKFKK